MNAKRLLIRFALLLLATLVSFASVAHAGDIVGQVTDGATGRFLPGATVRITQPDRSTVTDRQGRYRIANLPAGAYTVRVTSMGHDSASLQVEVPAVGTAEANFTLSGSLMELEGIVVEGYLESRTMGMQQKRAAPNIMDVLSADAIGNLPDHNAAEAISRLPGVGLSLNQGEGVFVSIRGSEPNLNQVLLDGATMAAPGGTRLGRAVPLDVVSASSISQIEVIKSVTPDMDGNAVGGTVNIKTTSAFDSPDPVHRYTVEWNYNETRSKNDWAANATWADTLGADNNIGLAISVNFDQRSAQHESLQIGGFSLRSSDGLESWVPSNFQVKPHTIDRQRWGANINLEVRADPDTRYYLRPTFSNQIRWRNEDEVIFNFDNNANRITLTSPTTAVYQGGRIRVERREFRDRRDQTLFNVAAGMEKVIGNFTVESAITYSYAEEERVYNNSLQFRTGRGPHGDMTFDYSSFIPSISFANNGWNDPSVFPLRRTREDSGDLEEKTWTAKVDLRWDSNNILGHHGFLKTGIKFINRDRVVDLNSFRLNPTSNWMMSEVGAMLPSRGLTYNSRFDPGFRMDWDGIWNFIRNNPALTAEDPVESATNNVEDDYNLDEDIIAAYLMGQVHINQLTLIAGARYERTKGRISANEIRFEDGDFTGVFPQQGGSTFDNFMPNAQFIFDPIESLKIRGGFTRTIGRPDYQDMRPFSEFEFDGLLTPLNPSFPFTGSLEIGNPNLGPFESDNFDLSVEYYGPLGGVWAVAGFYKRVDDPIYTFEEERTNVVHNGFGMERLDLEEVRNADRGRIRGLEFTFYQPFSFLPEPLNGFGIDLNHTMISSDVDIPTRPGEDLRFFRQPGAITNATFFYERARFGARIAYRYEASQLWSVGGNPSSDIYRESRDQLDFLTSYRLSERFTLRASIRNIQRSPELFSHRLPANANAPASIGMRTAEILERDFRISLTASF